MCVYVCVPQCVPTFSVSPQKREAAGQKMKHLETVCQGAPRKKKKQEEEEEEEWLKKKKKEILTGSYLCCCPLPCSDTWL